jgi:hypothetical protein
VLKQEKRRPGRRTPNSTVSPKPYFTMRRVLVKRSFQGRELGPCGMNMEHPEQKLSQDRGETGATRLGVRAFTGDLELPFDPCGISLGITRRAKVRRIFSFWRRMHDGSESLRVTP